MSYAGFGIRSMKSLGKPKKVFKPVFEQLNSGEHPRSSNNKSISKTWTQFREHIDREELNDAAMTNRIYVVTTLSLMAALIISLI